VPEKISAVNENVDSLQLPWIAASGTLDYLGFLSSGVDGTHVRLALMQA
jgi:hypothetical protein